jgi:hypothetical protein
MFSDYDRDDVIDNEMRHKFQPNSFSTTIETTTFRGQEQQTPETPGTTTNMRNALRGVEFIAQHIKNADKDNEVSIIASVFNLFATKLSSALKGSHRHYYQLHMCGELLLLFCKKLCNATIGMSMDFYTL